MNRLRIESTIHASIFIYFTAENISPVEIFGTLARPYLKYRLYPRTDWHKITILCNFSADFYTFTLHKIYRNILLH